MWQRINDLVNKHTIFSAFLLSAFFTAILTLVGLPTMQGTMEQNIGIPIMLVYQIALAAIGILFMKKLKVLDKSDFKLKNAGKGLLFGWIVFVLAIILVLSNYSNRSEYFITPEPLFLLTVLLFPFSTALLEETVYRGLVLKVLIKNMADTKKGMIVSFIVAVVLFAAVHSIHLIWTDPVEVVADVIFATAGATLFGAIYLRTKTLIATILLHGFMNLSGGIFIAFTSPEYTVPQATVSDIATMLIVALPLLILSFFLLRKVELGGNQMAPTIVNESILVLRLSDLSEKHWNLRGAVVYSRKSRRRPRNDRSRD